jgi:hypothetical protein
LFSLVEVATVFTDRESQWHRVVNCCSGGWGGKREEGRGKREEGRGKREETSQ